MPSATSPTPLLTERPLPSGRPLPIVSGKPRTPTHRRFEENAGLIWSAINRRFPALLADPDSAADAWSAGALGLLGACERFDANRGRAFSTFAVVCIEGEILRHLRARGTAIKRPGWHVELSARISRYEQTFQAQTGRMPTDVETAQALGVSPAKIKRVRTSRDVFAVVSLDALAGERGEGGRELQEMIPDHRSEFQPGAQLLAEAGMNAHLGTLPPLQRHVIEEVYFEEQPHKIIAEELGLTPHRVSNLHTQALETMRKNEKMRRAAIPKKAPKQKQIGPHSRRRTPVNPALVKRIFGNRVDSA